MLCPEMSIKEEVAKLTLIGLASIRYDCSNLLYRGATITFFSVWQTCGLGWPSLSPYYVYDF